MSLTTSDILPDSYDAFLSSRLQGMETFIRALDTNDAYLLTYVHHFHLGLLLSMLYDAENAIKFPKMYFPLELWPGPRSWI